MAFLGTAEQLGLCIALYNYDPTSQPLVPSERGRGGGLYIHITSDQCSLAPIDSTVLSRVRFEENQAFSGSAIWSDHYDLKIMSNQCLITNNIATSPSSALVNLDSTNVANPGDPNAGATIWGRF